MGADAAGGAPPGGAEGGEASADTPADARARLAEIEIEIEQLGGASCGWAEEEHAAFIKLRTRLLGPVTELAAATALAVAQGESSLKMRALRSRGREAAAAMAGLLNGFGHDDVAVCAHEEDVQRRELLQAQL